MPSATLVSKTYLQELLKNMGFARTAELEDAVQDIMQSLAAKAENVHSHTLEDISGYEAPYSKAETEKLIAEQIAEQIAKIIADAPESFDTLKELSDWIAEHQDEAGTMNSAISANRLAIDENASAIKDNAEAIVRNAQAITKTEASLEEKLEKNQNELNQRTTELEETLSRKIDSKADKTELAKNIETLNNRISLLASTEKFEEARNALQNATETNAQNIEVNAKGIAENTRAISSNASAINDNAEAIATIVDNMFDKRQVMQVTGESMSINKTSPTELAVLDLEKGTYLVFVETTITGANYSQAEIFGSHYLLNMQTQSLSMFACKTLSRAKELSIAFTPVGAIYDNLRTSGTKVTAVKIA